VPNFCQCCGVPRARGFGGKTSDFFWAHATRVVVGAGVATGEKARKLLLARLHKERALDCRRRTSPGARARLLSALRSSSKQRNCAKSTGRRHSARGTSAPARP